MANEWVYTSTEDVAGLPHNVKYQLILNVVILGGLNCEICLACNYIEKGIIKIQGVENKYVQECDIRPQSLAEGIAIEILYGSICLIYLYNPYIINIH